MKMGNPEGSSWSGSWDDKESNWYAFGDILPGKRVMDGGALLDVSNITEGVEVCHLATHEGVGVSLKRGLGMEGITGGVKNKHLRYSVKGEMDNEGALHLCRYRYPHTSGKRPRGCIEESILSQKS